MGIIERLKKFRDTPAVIFGASREGRTASRILADYNVAPECFIDNNKLKNGTETSAPNSQVFSARQNGSGSGDSAPIYPPGRLLEMNDFIVIVPSVYYREMCAQLADMKIPKSRIYNFEIYEDSMCLFDVPYRLRVYMLLNKYFPRR